MRTSTIRGLRSLAMAVALIITLSTAAAAQPVTISGSGTIRDWLFFQGTRPPELEAAFPPGEPFTATVTYDPTLVYLVTSLSDTQVAHWGAVTSLAASAAGHSIAHAGVGGPAFVFNDTPSGGIFADAIQAENPVTVDGSATFAGFEIRAAGVVGVLDIPEAAFERANANADRGRRNALSNRLQAAANQIAAGNFEEALAILEHVLDLLDGDPSPPDVMEDGPEKNALRAEVERLIALMGAR